uniref:Uncharacterized protein n=1 Tax=Cucumis melo TaxID=3656 RepID=A0A9I9DI53_CUCME
MHFNTSLYHSPITTTRRRRRRRRRKNRNGLLLLSRGSDSSDTAEQTGCRILFPVWRRSQRRRHEDRYKILFRPILLEVLESHYLHFLWSYYQILSLT